MGWETSNRRDRLPENWKQLRRQVFAIHGDVCHVCDLRGANEVDHVRAGDDHSLDNLRPIHGRGSGFRCHATKSAREGNYSPLRNRISMFRKRERHPGLR